MSNTKPTLYEKVKQEFETIRARLKDLNPEKEKVVKTAKFTQAQKFGELELPEGATLIFDTEMLEKGSAVTIKTADGESIPVADGEYEIMIEDEMKVIIKVEAGIVTEYTPVEPKTEDAPVDDEEMKDEKTDAKPTMNYEQEIADLKNSIAELANLVKSMGENNSKMEKETGDSRAIIVNLSAENAELKKRLDASVEVAKETFALVEKLASEPSAEPATKDKSMYKKTEVTNVKIDLTDVQALSKKAFGN